MDILSILFLVLTGLNAIPSGVWIYRTTSIPDQGYAGSNKPLRIRNSFEQLFTGPSNALSWVVITSMVFAPVCLIFFILVNLLPVLKSSDTVLAISLVLLTIPLFVAFGYGVQYMQTPMFQGALSRYGSYFETGNSAYLWFMWNPIIFISSAVSTLLTVLGFFYAAYDLYTRPEVFIGGRRKHLK